MKRFVLMVFILVCLLPSVFSESSIVIRQGYMSAIQGDTTVVSGLMTENTTWTFEGSPYIVEGDVIVNLDVFLTIEPGVTVKFTNGTNLIVDGHLTAQGNVTHKIMFTSNSTTPARGDWGGINIREYSSPTEFKHIKIEYASTALAVAVECNITDSSFQHNDGKAISIQSPGNIYMSDVQVINNTGTGISLTGQNIAIEDIQTSKNGAGIGVGGVYAYVYIRNITATENTGVGLSFRTETNATVYNANVSANGGMGISGPFAGRLYLLDSSATHNGGVGLYARDLGSVNVEDSTLFNNTYGGLNLDTRADVTLKRCSIVGNREHGIETFYENGIRVYNSSIRGNVGDGIYGRERCSFGIYNTNISNNENGIVDHGGGSIHNSIIQNNSGYGVRSFSLYTVVLDESVVKYNQYGLYADEGGFRISRSEIVDNTVGVYTTQGSLNALSSTIANNSLVNVETQTLTMKYCEVSNSSAGIITGSGSVHHSNIYDHAGYNIENMGGSDINATHNWWGTANETAVEERIYDFYDNLALGRVFYKPYLTAPIEVDITPPSITDISQKPEDDVQPEDEVKINATINDSISGVREVTLAYTYTNSSGSWDGVVEMTNLEGNIWSATIPALPAYTNVTYTIEAEDNVGNVVTTDELGYELEYPVIPELPSLPILSIFIIMTMLTAIILRKIDYNTV